MESGHRYAPHSILSTAQLRRALPVADRVRHDEKAGDEIDANDQGPDERDPVSLIAV